MLKYETLLCIPYSTCPTVYVNKHLSCLTYGRVPRDGSNYVGTRNLRIVILISIFLGHSIFQGAINKASCSLKSGR